MFKTKESSPSPAASSAVIAQAAKTKAAKTKEQHDEYRGSLVGFRSGGRRGRNVPAKDKDSFVRGYN